MYEIYLKVAVETHLRANLYLPDYVVTEICGYDVKVCKLSNRKLLSDTCFWIF